MILPNRQLAVPDGTPHSESPVSTAAQATDNSRGRAELLAVVTAFRRAQARRVATGESLRAVLQGRDLRFGEYAFDDVATMLERIGKGAERGPVPVLGREYRRALEDESEYQEALEGALACEPLWVWLGNERGIGAVLAARLMARVRFDVARRPSSVWRYCGLSTVEAGRWACEACGASGEAQRGSVPRTHRALRGRSKCDGVPRIVEGASGRIAAARFGLRGVKPLFDKDAKVTCYLIGVSFLRTRSPRARLYAQTRERLQTLHPDWPRQRTHLGAIRVMVKEFLRECWNVAHDLPPSYRPSNPDVECEESLGERFQPR